MNDGPTVSDAARDLAQDADFIDLHVDSFIPARLYGYDVERRHRGPGWLFGQWDLPRARAAHLDGAMWSITTQPFGTDESRWNALRANLERLQSWAENTDGVALVGGTAEYRTARANGDLALFPAIQGGNALDRSAGDTQSLPPPGLVRVTLVHLTPSKVGAPNHPFHWFRGDKGLTAHGRTMVERLNHQRVFVDLAHLHPTGVDDALDVHDRRQPLVATHTGVDGVHRHWRNLSDDHLKAIADTGGVVGIVTADLYLGRVPGRSGVDRFLDHVDHVIRVAGEGTPAIGTDWDGFILPPVDLRGAHAYLALVDGMLARGWSEARVRGVLGANFLRALADLRG